MKLFCELYNFFADSKGKIKEKMSSVVGHGKYQVEQVEQVEKTKQKCLILSPPLAVRSTVSTYTASDHFLFLVMVAEKW